MAKEKITYRCSECGWTSPKWVGQCRECGAWGTVDQAGEASGGVSSLCASVGMTLT